MRPTAGQQARGRRTLAVDSRPGYRVDLTLEDFTRKTSSWASGVVGSRPKPASRPSSTSNEPTAISSWPGSGSPMGNVKIARAANYIKLVEDALKKTPGNAEMEAELQRARDEHAGAIREKEEAEAEQKLSEAQQSHAFFMKEQDEDRQERLTFRKVSFWQHMATYLLYFVMLLNVFITTFGISTGVSHHDNPNILPPTTMANFGYHASHAHSIVSPGIVQNHSTNGR